ncbi:hypothetical protein [Nitrospirillum pindoramense]|uniref:Uncharacterized protein n=1 Tax=Nitrospirillum amazonense TaxID=28077 RepID=A0A560HER0_9PROT|nr:hypothetical protein [Nitrospirillum amazonense]TWB43870.1 hypothetical protein FBZ90_104258 [Nitrospirillum amazonense]
MNAPLRSILYAILSLLLIIMLVDLAMSLLPPILAEALRIIVGIGVFLFLLQFLASLFRRT